MRSEAKTDQVLGPTKWVAGVVTLVLLTAFVLLYGWPERTTQTFAWTINPPMTAVFMGSAYGAGVYFFARVFGARRWHTVAADFLPIAIFTAFLGVATLMHIDRFNHAHISFDTWFALYVTTPFLVPALWLWNRRTDPGTPDERDAVVLIAVRCFAACLGVVIFAGCLVAFVRPAAFIAAWPWKVTPLTARVLLGFFSWFGTIGISLASDRRWSAWRIIVHSQLIGIGLIVVGAMRRWADFDPANPLALGFVGFNLVLLALLAALTVVMERRAAAGVARQP